MKENWYIKPRKRNDNGVIETAGNNSNSNNAGDDFTTVDITANNVKKKKM